MEPVQFSSPDAILNEGLNCVGEHFIDPSMMVHQ